MWDYDYRGYIIHTNDSGVYINDMEFVSTDEAEEWIDSQLDDIAEISISDANSEERLFIIFFVAPHANKHSTVEVNSFDINEAIAWVENIYCPGAHVIDWNVLDD